MGGALTAQTEIDGTERDVLGHPILVPDLSLVSPNRHSHQDDTSIPLIKTHHANLARSNPPSSRHVGRSKVDERAWSALVVLSSFQIPSSGLRTSSEPPSFVSSANPN